MASERSFRAKRRCWTAAISSFCRASARSARAWRNFARAGWNAGHFVNLLEGSVRWEKVIPALRKAGYDGYLTAELSAMPKTPEYLYESTVKALDTILAM